MLCNSYVVQNNRCEINIQVNRLRTEPIAKNMWRRRLCLQQKGLNVAGTDDPCKELKNQDKDK